MTAPAKETIRSSVRVVKNASVDDIYTFYKPKFQKRNLTPFRASNLLVNHYLPDIFAPITLCGKYMKSGGLTLSSLRPVTAFAVLDCRVCRRRYLPALERFLNEEIFAKNPKNPLDGFMSMNEEAVKKTENYSEEKLIKFLAKQILIG